jgi:hypothetical protein
MILNSSLPALSTGMYNMLPIHYCTSYALTVACKHDKTGKWSVSLEEEKETIATTAVEV